MKFVRDAKREIDSQHVFVDVFLVFFRIRCSVNLHFTRSSAKTDKKCVLGAVGNSFELLDASAFEARR